MKRRISSEFARRRVFADPEPPLRWSRIGLEREFQHDTRPGGGFTGTRTQPGWARSSWWRGGHYFPGPLLAGRGFRSLGGRRPLWCVLRGGRSREASAGRRSFGAAWAVNPAAQWAATVDCPLAGKRDLMLRHHLKRRVDPSVRMGLRLRVSGLPPWCRRSWAWRHIGGWGWATLPMPRALKWSRSGPLRRQGFGPWPHAHVAHGDCGRTGAKGRACAARDLPSHATTALAKSWGRSPCDTGAAAVSEVESCARTGTRLERCARARAREVRYSHNGATACESPPGCAECGVAAPCSEAQARRFVGAVPVTTTGDDGERLGRAAWGADGPGVGRQGGGRALCGGCWTLSRAQGLEFGDAPSFRSGLLRSQRCWAHRADPADTLGPARIAEEPEMPGCESRAPIVDRVPGRPNSGPSHCPTSYGERPPNDGLAWGEVGGACRGLPWRSGAGLGGLSATG